MKNFSLGLLLAIALAPVAQPAIAQAESAPDARDSAGQYLDARALYGVETSDGTEFLTAYPNRVMAGIDGEWAPINLLLEGDVAEIDDRMAAMCGSPRTFLIARTSDYAFGLTRGRPDIGRGAMTAIYTAPAAHRLAAAPRDGGILHPHRQGSVPVCQGRPTVQSEKRDESCSFPFRHGARPVGRLRAGPGAQRRAEPSVA